MPDISAIRAKTVVVLKNCRHPHSSIEFPGQGRKTAQSTEVEFGPITSGTVSAKKKSFACILPLLFSDSWIKDPIMFLLIFHCVPFRLTTLLHYGIWTFTQVSIFVLAEWISRLYLLDVHMHWRRSIRTDPTFILAAHKARHARFKQKNVFQKISVSFWTHHKV